MKRILLQPRFILSIVLALAACSLASVVCAQQIELTTPLPHDPNVIYGKLANGLTYFIRKNAKPENRVELRLAVKAGSILENDDQQGLAHFTEHMAFNGTKKYPKNDLINFLESSGVRFGAHLNAYTSFDETVYMLQLPTNKGDVLHKGLEVLSEWSHNVTFDTTEINKERGVVGEEWRLGLGADQRIEDKQFPVILKGSRYAERITIGKKPILDTCHHATLINFYKEWYRPDLMAVIIVGDVDPNEMLAEVKALFSQIPNPANERPRTEYGIPEHTEPYVSIETDKELSSASFEMEFTTPRTEQKTVRDVRQQLIWSLCDRMFNQRISDLLSSSSPPYINAGENEGGGLDHTHTVNFYTSLKSDSIVQGIHAALREAMRVEEQGFTAGELERVKLETMTGVENQLKDRQTTNDAVYAGQYVRSFLQHAPFAGIEFNYQVVKKYLPGITLEEINKHAKERMEKGSMTLTVAAPQSDTIKIPHNDQLLSLLAKIKREKLPAYVDKTSDEPLVAHLPKPGKITGEKRIRELGVTEWTLSNGAKVVLKPTAFKADEILFGAHANGGTSLAPDEKILSAQIAAGFVDASGVGNLDNVALRKKLSGKTVSVSPYLAPLEQGFRGTSRAADLETLAQLTYLFFTSPRIDSNAVQAIMVQQKNFLQNRDRNPAAAFQDTLNATLTQYSARHRRMTLERLSEIDPMYSLQFYKERFADPSGFTFYFVGSFDTNKLRPLIEQYFASIPSRSKPTSWKDDGVVPPTGVIAKKVYKGVEPKSSVSITISGPFEWSLKNRFELTELAEVLSIKLREDLREDKSGVYGIGVNAAPTRYPTARYTIGIRFGCDPARVDELVAEVMKQLDTATMRPFDTVYVHKSQELQRSEEETSLKENNFWMGLMTSYPSMGEDPREFLKRHAWIDQLTADEIQAAAKKYLSRENMITVELFPEQKK